MNKNRCKGLCHAEGHCTCNEEDLLEVCIEKVLKIARKLQKKKFKFSEEDKKKIIDGIVGDSDE